MNNFERRLLLDYLYRLKNSINYNSYGFDELLELIMKEFRIKRSNFAYDEDGNLLSETIRQRAEIRRKLKNIVAGLIDKQPVINTRLEQRFELVRNIYNLDDNEYKSFVFLQMREISTVFEFFDQALSGNGFDTFCKCYLKVRGGEKDKIINNLYLNKLITSKCSHPSIYQDMIKVFDDKDCNTPEKVAKVLLGKPEKSDLTLKDYSHIEKEAKKAISILKSAVEQKAKGINILLYGFCGTGKTQFSKLLANISKVPIFPVTTENSNGDEAKREDRLADLHSKQQILSRSGNACILFDEAEDIMNREFSSTGTASKGYLNRIIESTPVPVIWTTNSIDVDPAFLRRMTYAIEFDRLSEEKRLQIWNKVIRKNGLKVSKSKIVELNKAYDVSPSIICNAIETTKMIGGDENDFEDLIESVAKVVTNKKDVKEKGINEIRDYDLSLINSDIDIYDLTEKIKESGNMNFSLCLYGEPGTSKSSYAKYLSKQLGVECILKRASDLMSAYVGETEQNIASAFAEAKSKGAMLVFDEADTFLQNRSNAVRSWEYSQVNEMLTQMESAEYPFVCTTNLIDTLDEAALRRFTFKIKFNFLTIEQANRAMYYFFKIKNADININGLTAGDFVTVKKKADFLRITDKYELIKMLKDEVKIKKSAELKNTIGF